ncbi:MAG: chemotaxis-specific protein-glutamate methyltransferase CheB [Syntrophobacteraceae bacterium]|jgi:two-component system chemotaxis response regulator CheB
MSIKALIVEDSAVVRELLNHILSSDPAIHIVGTANNGTEALQAVQALKPDVVTMDINMPVMDGYEATRRIMETHPVPIVIVSVSVDPREVATTIRALNAGALAAVQKPMGIGHPDHEHTAKTLVQTVKLMSEVKVVKRWPMRYLETPPRPVTGDSISTFRETGADNIEIIAMGASAGGPPTLQTILSRLPVDMPVPILVVQHISPGFIDGFAQFLAVSCKLPVHVAIRSEDLKAGHVYLAPGGTHMGVVKGGRVDLFDGAHVNGVRPSISYLFQAVADVFANRAAGVLLTGMGRDGAEGLKSMKDKGAVTIAQNEESSLVFSMPCEAIKLGAATHVLSPHEIAAALSKLVRKQ